MKCVCTQACQKRVNGKIKYYHRGDLETFDECPSFFKPVDGQNINFLTASEGEMMEARWAVKDAKLAMKLGYDVDLQVDPDDKKRDIVNRILDIRKRNQPVTKDK
jgi:hypothetical protein